MKYIKNFNKIKQISQNNIFFKNEYLKNIYWYETIHKDGHYIANLDLNANNTDTKKSIFYFNDWLSYCSNNKIHDINIFIDNPNIKKLSNNIQNISYSNESFYFRNMLLKYDNDFIHFTKKTNYMNSNIETKYKNNNIIYGQRHIKLLSCNIDYKNYNIDKIHNLLNYDLNIMMNYNIQYPIIDSSKNLLFKRFYNETIVFKNSDLLISNLYNFQKKLENNYSNKELNIILPYYIKNIFIKNNDFNTDDLKNDLYKIKNNIIFNNNIYINNEKLSF
jgi:hypothetical protein